MQHHRDALVIADPMTKKMPFSGGTGRLLTLPCNAKARERKCSELVVSPHTAESGNALWDGFAALFHKIETAHDLPKVQERTYFPEECYDLTDVCSHWSDAKLKRIEDAMILFVKELQDGTRIKFREEAGKEAEAIYMSRPSYFIVNFHEKWRREVNDLLRNVRLEIGSDGAHLRVDRHPPPNITKCHLNPVHITIHVCETGNIQGRQLVQGNLKFHYVRIFFSCASGDLVCATEGADGGQQKAGDYSCRVLAALRDSKQLRQVERMVRAALTEARAALQHAIEKVEQGYASKKGRKWTCPATLLHELFEYSGGDASQEVIRKSLEKMRGWNQSVPSPAPTSLEDMETEIYKLHHCWREKQSREDQQRRKQERENRERKQIEVRQKIPKKPPKRDDEQRRRERELKKMVQLATEGAREAQWEYLRFKEDMRALYRGNTQEG